MSDFTELMIIGHLSMAILGYALFGILKNGKYMGRVYSIHQHRYERVYVEYKKFPVKFTIVVVFLALGFLAATVGVISLYAQLIR